jgi:hypothetical protein
MSSVEMFTAEKRNLEAQRARAMVEGEKLATASKANAHLATKLEGAVEVITALLDAATAKSEEASKPVGDGSI